MRLERTEDVAVVRLHGGKANAMTREFLDGMRRLVDEASECGARGMILIGYEKYFSAGLALPALLPLDRAAMREFIDFFSDTMLHVFRCPLPVVAAVNGHAVAGGCVLALMADVRIMADGEGRIGLPEVQLGIGLPSSVVEPLRAQVPPQSLVPLAVEGRMLPPADALRLGLIDEIAPPDALEARAVERARQLSRAPNLGFSQVKLALRRPAIDAVARYAEIERERWLDAWFSPAGQALLQAAVARLSR